MRKQVSNDLGSERWVPGLTVGPGRGSGVGDEEGGLKSGRRHRPGVGLQGAK